MHRNIRYIIILTLLGTSLFGQKSIKQEIQKLIKYDTDLDYGKNNGFQIAIIDNDTSFVLKLGNIDTTSSQLYETGSVTKSMTASLITRLVNQSYFKFTDPINNFLPSTYTNPRLEHVRIIDLIEQTSGFSKKPSNIGSREINIQNPYSNYSKLDLLKFYRDYLPHSNAYGNYLYSHTNYALLEIIIENATQEKFEELMFQELFEPLEMHNSFIGLSEYVEENLADGYDRSHEQVAPWTFRSFAASNGLKTTIHDLVKFVNANIQTNKYNTNQEKRILTNLNDRIYGALGWHVIVNESIHNIITTSGKTSGHHCMITFIKETKTGVIIMSNTAFGSKNLAYLVLRMINNNWERTATDDVQSLDQNNNFK